MLSFVFVLLLSGSHSYLAQLIDYYLENEDSHSWPEKLNVHMTKLSINDWKKGMLDAGFKDVEIHQVASKEGFPGTLVMLGRAIH